MLPNRWVIVWDKLPTGLDGHGHIFKTETPFHVHWYPNEPSAWDVLALNRDRYGMTIEYASIEEIQFRIL